jgi:hypothetical protein
MSQPWVIVDRRYGDGSRSPTVAQLREAITELYHETLPSMTEGDYAEHGAASLRYGYDEGPMYVVEINRLREVTLEQWADQDYEQELAPPRSMSGVPEDHALRLWSWLAEGKIEQVQSQPWE